MTTGTKVLSDVAERKQEPLSLPGRGEAFHHPFPDSGRLMGVLSPVIEVFRAAMGHRRNQLAVSDPVAGQLVGDNNPRHIPQALEQLAEKSLGCFGVSPRLDQDVEHVAVLVDRAPQVMRDAVDLDENLIEVPFIAGARSAPTQLVGVVRPELGTPGSDRLVGEHHTAGQHQLLNVAQAQRKTVIQPHRVPDDLDRIPIALVSCRNRHRPILAAPHQTNNLTMPFRFPLSFREVEELMLARGVAVSYETIRRWCAKFGQAYANQLGRRRPRPGDKWHLDEVFIRISGRLRYLWRAVDQHGNVLDVLVQSRRNAVAAKRFFRKLLKGLRYLPRVLVTDKLGSYQVAHRELMSSVEHRRSRYLNNRAENSHQPTRQRERAMKRFKSSRHAQRFLSAFSGISAHFRPRRHLLSATEWRTEMADRFAVWRQVTVPDAAA